MNRWCRSAASLAMALVCCLTVSACSSPLALPSSGNVQTLEPMEQQSRRVYTNPQGPVEDAQPESIVKGFYDAMPAGVQSDGYHVARQFLASSASAAWDGDGAALIYNGTPDFRRRANTLTSPQGTENSLIVEVELQVVGTLDQNGSYRPVHDSEPRKIPYTLVQHKGQWRISRLDDGVVISVADFDQVFRQVSVYQVASSGKQMIPDVRWLSWRNWRARAVLEVLGDVPDWLRGAVKQADVSSISLTTDSIPVQNNVVEVRLTSGINAMSDEDRAILVHRIRLTLGDGGTGYSLKVTGDGVDYSDADTNLKLGVDQPAVGVYTLTGGHIVSLSSSSPLRIADVSDAEDASGLAYSANGGAVLHSNGIAECLNANGGSCGTAFGGARLKSLTSGADGEVWGVGEDGRTLYVFSDGKTVRLEIPWLDYGGQVSSVNVSPEGSRLALAIDGGALSGVAVTGVIRDSSNTVTGLSDAAALVSQVQHVAMLTFYNDLNLVYATEVSADGNQAAYRQIVPGPAVNQRLPEGSIVSMASGQISLYRRLAVLDSTGNVRSVSGSLDGSWSIADSQVDALGSQ